MPISYQNGSEIVFNYRHGSSRNLNGTVLVTAKLDPNTNGQGTKIQVGTSSEPISQIPVVIILRFILCLYHLEIM